MPVSIVFFFFFHLDELVQYIAHLLPCKSVSPLCGAEPAAAPRKKAGKMQPGGRVHRRGCTSIGTHWNKVVRFGRRNVHRTAPFVMGSFFLFRLWGAVARKRGGARGDGRGVGETYGENHPLRRNPRRNPHFLPSVTHAVPEKCGGRTTASSNGAMSCQPNLSVVTRKILWRGIHGVKHRKSNALRCCQFCLHCFYFFGFA